MTFRIRFSLLILIAASLMTGGCYLGSSKKSDSGNNGSNEADGATPDAQRADSDVAPKPDQASSCPAPLIWCDGMCRDTRSDSDHCGGCGQRCEGDQLCVDGECQPQSGDCRQSPCPSGYYCDLNSGVCKAGCGSTDDCPPMADCDLVTHQCSCIEKDCGGFCCKSSEVCHAGTCCTPSCAGKQCGASDGCGGACKTGSCPSDSTCVNGTCKCDHLSCGAQCCASGQVCSSANACCTPDCGSAVCGTEPVCGTSCGSCSTDKPNCIGGQCTFCATAAETECGDVCCPTGQWCVPTLSPVVPPVACCPKGECATTDYSCQDDGLCAMAGGSPVLQCDGSDGSWVMCDH